MRQGRRVAPMGPKELSQLLLQVPILTEDTAELLPNHCLVRFTGMVRPFSFCCPLSC